jgi:hypothetical protein
MNIKKKFSTWNQQSTTWNQLESKHNHLSMKKQQKIIQKIFEIPLYVSLFWMTHGII